ncbi:hypothetical protein [Pararhodobacter sp.]|uniref:hypothetical protein n=1 Tax=Pararhodobacter sp. TaxID=2127056 RepID=UPI002AFE1C74|nr:hypothetical protein [Pararhodobacter sp.]
MRKSSTFDEFLTGLIVALAWLSGLSSYLAVFGGTCTMGDASQLVGGALSALLLFPLVSALAWSPNQRILLVGSLPLAPILLWQAYFAITFALDVLLLGQAACESLHNASHTHSRIENWLAVLWLFLGLGMPGLMALALWSHSRTGRPKA